MDVNKDSALQFADVFADLDIDDTPDDEQLQQESDVILRRVDVDGNSQIDAFLLPAFFKTVEEMQLEDEAREGDCDQVDEGAIVDDAE